MAVRGDWHAAEDTSLTWRSRTWIGVRPLGVKGKKPEQALGVFAQRLLGGTAVLLRQILVSGLPLELCEGEQQAETVPFLAA